MHRLVLVQCTDTDTKHGHNRYHSCTCDIHGTCGTSGTQAFLGSMLCTRQGYTWTHMSISGFCTPAETVSQTGLHRLMCGYHAPIHCPMAPTSLSPIISLSSLVFLPLPEPCQSAPLLQSPPWVAPIPTQAPGLTLLCLYFISDLFASLDASLTTTHMLPPLNSGVPISLLDLHLNAPLFPQPPCTSTAPLPKSLQ